MSNFVEETVAQRVQGDDPSRVRALGAAIIIGVAAAVLAYRLLRGQGGGGADPGADQDRG
jgi:hypothetical protein